jgi:hypothetical protein
MTQDDLEMRAARAASLMNDPFLSEILDRLRDDAIAAWEQTSTDGAGQREFSWMMVKTVNRLRNVIQGYIDEPKITARAVRQPQ